MATQTEKAESFRNLHRRGEPLVLVNAWDAVSARIIEELGFPAIATTSAGIAWLEGFADGERISRERMLAGVQRVVGAVGVPVTADLEAAYGPSVQDATATAVGAIRAGAVGLNFEDFDARSDALLDVHAQTARITAMRQASLHAGVPLVINARTDVFLRDIGDSNAWRVEEAVHRGNRYLEAGADCVFVPGVADERTITTLVSAISGPLNVLAAPSSPSVPRLAELGVARISVGSAAMAYVLAQLRSVAASIQQSESFTFARERIPHAELNELFEPSAARAARPRD
jgi:2-methylisocitrate lyase-like PEP mutase family enzyme